MPFRHEQKKTQSEEVSIKNETIERESGVCARDFISVLYKKPLSLMSHSHSYLYKNYI